MKKIKLTNGKYALVDDKDFEYLSQWKWKALDNEHTWYAYRQGKENGINKRIYMHRVITNCPKGLVVDHIKHNGLDNQRKNIRICSVSDNSRNKRHKNKSGYKGVRYRENRENPFNPKIFLDGKEIGLGHYKDAKDAARIYDYKAKELFGEFAYLNFPNSILLKSEYEKLYRKREKKSSKYTGVHYHKVQKKYHIYVGGKGKNNYLGSFIDEEEAAKSRDKYILDNGLDLNKNKLNFPIKHLIGCRTYLVGSIEAISDAEAIGWRTRATEYLLDMGVKVFDPTRKDNMSGLDEIGKERRIMNYLKANHKWDEFCSRFKQIVHVDLRAVDHSDFIVAKIKNNVPHCGSIHEIVEARKQKKKVFLFTEDKIENTNSWLLWLVKPENIFETLEDVMNHLRKQSNQSLTYNLLSEA